MDETPEDIQLQPLKSALKRRDETEPSQSETRETLIKPRRREAEESTSKMSVSGYPGYYLNSSRASSYSDGHELEMKRYPSAASIGGHSLISGSRKSLYSTYTVSNTSYILPIITKQPDPIKRPPDNWGLAFCSLFINPLFGLLALLLAEKSKLYYTRSDYARASRYGAYAKGAASGGIIVMIVVIILIVAAALWNQYRFNW